jgi:N-acetylglucosamine kinase-like BadF-type ATPase
MSFFLAMDAGGTKTDYVLADETRELVRVRTGTIKRMRTDSETAARNLNSALAQITLQSGVSMQSITRTCVGTAGENIPLVADWLRHAMTSRVSGELLLLGDVEIALDAAFSGQAGVLVLAGTGSNVAGRMGDGTLTTAGGWGPALSDQGSGHKIGLESLKAVFLAMDEGRSTQLLPDMMDFWQLTTLNLLVERANSIPPPDYSELTELVLRAAESGDEVAAEVLHREGESLAYLVKLVMRRLHKSADNHEWVAPIAFAGSIMEKVSPVRKALISAVQREFSTVRVLARTRRPSRGCCLACA